MIASFLVNVTFWRDPLGRWAVCEGTGLSAAKGYLQQRPDNTWIIEGDTQGRAFLDQHSAAASVLNMQLPEGVQFYELKRQGETAHVATYPDVIDNLKQDGWAVISVSREY